MFSMLTDIYRSHYDTAPPLICTECKAIIDPDSLLLAKLTAKVELTSEFRITSHQLDFLGICPRLSKK